MLEPCYTTACEGLKPERMGHPGRRGLLWLGGAGQALLLKTGRRPGLYAGRRSSSGLSAFFSSCWASNQRVLGCKDIKRSWGLKDGIAIGGIYKPGKPRSLCMHCLKEIVVSAIEYNDTMFAVALHVG